MPATLTRPALVGTASSAGVIRVHRATCKRAAASPHGAYPLDTATPAELQHATPATCCKPQPEVVQDALDALASAEYEALIAAQVAEREAKATRQQEPESPHTQGSDDLRDRSTDGYVPAEGRNLVAEKRARLDAPRRSRSRKTGDPRADRSKAQPAAPEGLVQPLSAVAYPPVEQGTALCQGACAQVLPVTRFPWLVNKAAGLGRMVECQPCQVARLARNKQAKAEGRAPEPKPRAAL